MPDKIKFYADENISKAIIKGLHSRGVDILTVNDTKMYSANDREHLEKASSENRVIITHDTDFLQLASIYINHAGIVYIHKDKSIEDTIFGLMLIYQLLTIEEMKNHIEFL